MAAHSKLLQVCNIILYHLYSVISLVMMGYAIAGFLDGFQSLFSGSCMVPLCRISAMCCCSRLFWYTQSDNIWIYLIYNLPKAPQKDQHLIWITYPTLARAMWKQTFAMAQDWTSILLDIGRTGTASGSMSHRSDPWGVSFELLFGWW